MYTFTYIDFSLFSLCVDFFLYLNYLLYLSYFGVDLLLFFSFFRWKLRLLCLPLTETFKSINFFLSTPSAASHIFRYSIHFHSVQDIFPLCTSSLLFLELLSNCPGINLHRTKKCFF